MSVTMGNTLPEAIGECLVLSKFQLCARSPIAWEHVYYEEPDGDYDGETRQYSGNVWRSRISDDEIELADVLAWMPVPEVAS